MVMLTGARGQVRLPQPAVSTNFLEASMSNMIQISEAQFGSEVLDASTPVLVDFGAVWCQPCKMLDPVVKELANEWGDRVKVVKVDVDHNPDLAMRYSVMGVPTLILFKDGEPRERQSGFQPKKKLEARFAPLLG
jgi:thioredoxin 1